MSRPRSKAVIAALVSIDAGMTWAAAALAHGVNQSSIARARKPPDTIPQAHCPTCGKVVRKTK